jgi:PAS domain S-box-containing protein
VGTSSALVTQHDGGEWQAVFRRGLSVIDVRDAGYGDAPAALLGLTRVGLGWSCTGGEARELIERAFSTGEPIALARTWDDPRCGPRTFEFTLEPLGAGGEVAAVAIRCREVTARRAQVRALHVHAQLLDAMGEGVLLVEFDGGIVLANPAAEQMFGYGAGQLAGRRIAELGSDVATFVQRGPSTERRAGDVDAATPLEFRRLDGTEISLSATLRTLPGSTGRRLVVLRDVTERRRLERELIDTERRERERLARDLHDGVGQELTAVSLLLRGIATSLQRTQPEAAHDVEDVLKLVNGVLGGTRSMARGLFDAALPPTGLVGALEELAVRSSEGSGPAVRFVSRVEVALELDRREVVELYRIAQEATTNALKHASAQRIDIELDSEPDAVTLVVADDGCGLPPGGEAGNAGLGLGIMRYRAHALGTELVVEPRPGGGTRVECTVRRRAARD